MGRLIDADELKGCKILQPYIGCATGKAWIREIELDDIPTAYDVDEVVKNVQGMHLPLASQTSRIVGIIREGGISAAVQEGDEEDEVD